MASLPSRSRPLPLRRGSNAPRGPRLQRTQSATTGFYSMSKVSQQRLFTPSYFSPPIFPKFESYPTAGWPLQVLLCRIPIGSSLAGWMRPNVLPTCGILEQIDRNALLHEF